MCVTGRDESESHRRAQRDTRAGIAPSHDRLHVAAAGIEPRNRRIVLGAEHARIHIAGQPRTGADVAQTEPAERAEVPPTCSVFSTRRTSSPSTAAVRAAVMPAAPAPRTRRSTSPGMFVVRAPPPPVTAQTGPVRIGTGRLSGNSPIMRAAACVARM